MPPGMILPPGIMTAQDRFNINKAKMTITALDPDLVGLLVECHALQDENITNYTWLEDFVRTYVQLHSRKELDVLRYEPSSHTLEIIILALPVETYLMLIDANLLTNKFRPEMHQNVADVMTARVDKTDRKNIPKRLKENCHHAFLEEFITAQPTDWRLVRERFAAVWNPPPPESWNPPHTEGCVKYSLYILDADLRGFLAESGALNLEVATNVWFEGYIHNFKATRHGRLSISTSGPRAPPGPGNGGLRCSAFHVDATSPKMSPPPFNLDALAAWFEDNKDILLALKERTTQAESPEENFSLHGSGWNTDKMHFEETGRRTCVT
ncbi:uncharacterized protein J3D65DRAFT_666049 [Phyllosticta citribraziliensis]|uniref:Uncharacterized protein n=1 Tax=Phyllosticta citribraziliensis TaxID=989973 RepID=A0ABR1LXE4_9PEZI